MGNKIKELQVGEAVHVILFCSTTTTLLDRTHPRDRSWLTSHNMRGTAARPTGTSSRLSRRSLTAFTSLRKDNAVPSKHHLVWVLFLCFLANISPTRSARSSDCLLCDYDRTFVSTVTHRRTHRPYFLKSASNSLADPNRRACRRQPKPPGALSQPACVRPLSLVHASGRRSDGRTLHWACALLTDLHARLLRHTSGWLLLAVSNGHELE